jgi:hypothetical protein
MTATFVGSEGTARRFTGRLAMRGWFFLAVYIEAIGSGQPGLSEIATMVFDSISLRDGDRPELFKPDPRLSLSRLSAGKHSHSFCLHSLTV